MADAHYCHDDLWMSHKKQSIGKEVNCALTSLRQAWKEKEHMAWSIPYSLPG